MEHEGIKYQYFQYHWGGEEASPPPIPGLPEPPQWRAKGESYLLESIVSWGQTLKPF